MRKKVLVTAVAVCALSAACLFGATACNKSGDDDGSGVPDVGPSIEVTIDEYKAAYEKSVSADNYTYCVVNHEFGSYMGETYDATAVNYIYHFGNEQYSTSEVTSVESDGTYNYGSKEYIIVENSISYYCNYEDYGARGEWVVGTTSGEIMPTISSVLAGTDKLYLHLTFTGGKYKMDNNGYSVSIKINSDGYVSYYCEEGSGYKHEYIIYNYGTTNNSVVPAAAKQAVADFKAANN